MSSVISFCVQRGLGSAWTRLKKQQFPDASFLCPEPILRQDGTTKSDYERNATRRLLKSLRKEHPHLGLIVIEDGLASNGPHVEDLLDQGKHFILGAKPGDRSFLFDQVVKAIDDQSALTWEVHDPKKGERKSYTAVGNLSLNTSHRDRLVNFVSCTVEK